MPSQNELAVMYEKRDMIGGFSTGTYWSSSEFGVFLAWFQIFGSGLQYSAYEASAFYVRLVRAFSI